MDLLCIIAIGFSVYFAIQGVKELLVATKDSDVKVMKLKIEIWKLKKEIAEIKYPK